MATQQKKKRTCLDCGFLTIHGGELHQADRIMLGTRGQSAAMPANPEQTRCSKNLWANYDLSYSDNNFQGVMEELERNRDGCPGFASYKAGFTPALHKENQIEQRKEKLQWKIAKLAFCSVFVGAIGAILIPLLRWLFELFFAHKP